MSHPPLLLAARDFDAYAPEKATSNAYSRPRLEVKQRALAWARAVVARLGELGIAVDVHGSDEHPTLRNKKRVDCQWVFFWRDQGARDELDRLQGRGRSIAAEIDDPSPFTRHAFLALRLDSGAVEVCFAVHPEAQVDVENLRARLADEEAAAELTGALRALPEQFALGVSPEDRVAASSATPEALRAFVERAAAGQVPLWIGWSVSRETAIEHSALLDEQLEDAIAALAPIYRLVAWSRDNDRIALDRRLESAEQERALAHAEAEAQTERWRSEQDAARRSAAEQARARAVVHLENTRERSPGAGRGASARKPSLDTLFAGKKPAGAVATASTSATLESARERPAATLESARERSAATLESARERSAATLESARERSPTSASTTASARRTPPSRPVVAEGERVTPAPAAPPSLEKGVKVRVLSGPFADKVGVIGELDGRGSARVLLGLLSTRLDVADLEPVIEGRERPSLQSSHRRPLTPKAR